MDACLVLLTLTEHLQATQNERPVLARQLDQSKIGPASFRVEARPLPAAEKIKLRKLSQTVGTPCKPNEEAIAAGMFLQELQSRARNAGGDPPLPAWPDTKHLDDLAQQSGNEQLASVLAAEDRLIEEAQAWQQAADLAGKRMPRWKDLGLLLDHAGALPAAEEARPQIKVGTEQEVLGTLQQRPLPSWRDQCDALPTRFENARIEAARRLEPKAVSLKLPPATLKSEEDVDLWWEMARTEIVEKLKKGPVIIG